MESIMDAIETKLKEGATRKELIEEGFKKSTVYKVAKKLETKGGLGMDDRTLYLSYLIQQVYLDLSYKIAEEIGKSMTHDPVPDWDQVVKTTNEVYIIETGRQPPKKLYPEAT